MSVTMKLKGAEEFIGSLNTYIDKANQTPDLDERVAFLKVVIQNHDNGLKKAQPKLSFEEFRKMHVAVDAAKNNLGQLERTLHQHRSEQRKNKLIHGTVFLTCAYGIFSHQWEPAFALGVAAASLTAINLLKCAQVFLSSTTPTQKIKQTSPSLSSLKEQVEEIENLKGIAESYLENPPSDELADEYNQRVLRLRAQIALSKDMTLITTYNESVGLLAAFNDDRGDSLFNKNLQPICDADDKPIRSKLSYSLKNNRILILRRP